MTGSRGSYASTGAVLTMLGGVFFLFIAILVAFIGFVGLVAGAPELLPRFGTIAGLVIVGVLSLVFGYLVARQPDLTLLWAVLILIVSLLSLGLEFGGFVIGFLLTFIGGILAVAWKLGRRS